MRIAFIVYGALETLTGGYIYDRILVEHLKRTGHEVTVVPLAVRGYPGRLAHNLVRSVRQRIDAGRYDLLLQDELCHPSLLALNRRLQRTPALPVVSVVHQVFCDEPRHPLLNRLFAMVEKRYLDSVDGFVFNSPTTRAIVDRLSRHGRPFVIAPPGGDRLAARIAPPAIRERAFRAGPLRLLFLGNVIPRKGLLPLIEALAEVPRRHWRLEVVGRLEMDVRYVRAVKAAIRKCGLDRAVRLSGVKTGTALAAAVADSDLLCMPYAYEGFGIVTLEALSMGVPVIGSAAGATPDLIRHGVDGYLVDAGDSQGLRSAIQAFHADPATRYRMSQAALRRFGRHATWTESMAQVAAFLEEMASARREASKDRSRTTAYRPSDRIARHASRCR